MASIQELKKKVEIKIKSLDLAVRESKRILQRYKEKELPKHLLIYEKRQEEIYDLKYQIQELMISEESTACEIEDWSDQLEENVRRFEEPMTIMQDAINQWKEKKTIKNWKEEKIKLPKSVTSPFAGSHIQFFRFWNPFETQIAKSDLPCMTKLSYLNQMLVSKLQLLIKGLSCNSEGYERAKTILKSTYGKPSELVNARIQNILNLPVISGSNPVKTHDFYEK